MNLIKNWNKDIWFLTKNKHNSINKYVKTKIIFRIQQKDNVNIIVIMVQEYIVELLENVSVINETKKKILKLKINFLLIVFNMKKSFEQNFVCCSVDTLRIVRNIHLCIPHDIYDYRQKVQCNLVHL